MSENKPLDEFTAQVKVVKSKKGIPSVIEINGERYLWQPKDLYRPKPQSKESVSTPDPKTYTLEEVTGHDLSHVEWDENDGWQ